MIALDAIFSPVSRVRYNVESTRVGQITDLDKLNLTVETDGSLSPQEAFEQAAAILINQYTALAGSTRVEVGETLASTDLGDGSELTTSIEDLNLSARTANALINNEIRTVQDLVSLSEIELRELKGFGSRALDEVKDKLVELEL
jgi:DNA-directed RNA polymerase subunit alpha